MDRRGAARGFRGGTQKLIDVHKPDVLLLDQDEYEVLARAGKLYNLDPAIMQDQFDLNGYMTGVIDMLREKGMVRSMGWLHSSGRGSCTTMRICSKRTASIPLQQDAVA